MTPYADTRGCAPTRRAAPPALRRDRRADVTRVDRADRRPAGVVELPPAAAARQPPASAAAVPPARALDAGGRARDGDFDLSSTLRRAGVPPSPGGAERRRDRRAASWPAFTVVQQDNPRRPTAIGEQSTAVRTRRRAGARTSSPGAARPAPHEVLATARTRTRHPLERSRLRPQAARRPAARGARLSRTPTGSGCRTSASRRSTACSTPKPTSSASGCSCRRSRNWPSCSAPRRRCVTLESQTPVGDFDVIAFSVSFEWDYANVLTLLRLAGMPRYAAERIAAPSAGRDRRRRDVREPRAAGAVRRRHRRRRRRSAGAGASSARSRAAADRARPAAAARARARLLHPVVLRAAVRGRRHAGRLSRRATASDAPLPVRKAALKTTDAVDPPATGIFTPDTEFGSRFLIEVVRGCANLCRFCWAGYNYLPVRAFPADRILAARRERARAFEPRRPGVDRALRSPGDRADPGAPARDGLRDQPGVAAARRSDRRRSSQLLQRERRAHASRSRRKPGRIACAASSTRRSPTTRFSTAPS